MLHLNFSTPGKASNLFPLHFVGMPLLILLDSSLLPATFHNHQLIRVLFLICKSDSITHNLPFVITLNLESLIYSIISFRINFTTLNILCNVCDMSKENFDNLYIVFHSIKNETIYNVNQDTYFWSQRDLQSLWKNHPTPLSPYILCYFWLYLNWFAPKAVCIMEKMPS